MFHNIDLDTVLKGPFNNYVDKIRGIKMSVFVHPQGIKTVHSGRRGGQKMAKFCTVVVE